MTVIDIPDGVTSIGYGAFAYCRELASITVPNGVTSIGSGAFYETTWYNNQPDGLVYVGNVAYKYKGTMPDNTSVVIKDGACGIAGSAFAGCTGLVSVTLPNSVTNIGEEAFEGCSGLTAITIPDGVKSISWYAFRDCTGLTSVTIPYGVTSIESHAFLNHGDGSREHVSILKNYFEIFFHFHKINGKACNYRHFGVWKRNFIFHMSSIF